MIRKGISMVVQEKMLSQIIKSYRFAKIRSNTLFVPCTNINKAWTAEPVGVRNFSTGSALKMRFVQFECLKGGPQRLGVQLKEDGDIIDVSGVDPSIPNALVQLLKDDCALDKVKRIVADAKSVLQPSEVKLLAPVTLPDKVVCVGLNYSTHCDEQNIPYPEEPVLFSKWGSCIVGPTADVEHPHFTKRLDWEVEMAIVMGKTARCVSDSDAMDYVFGFSVAQDITAREWQKKDRNGGQWLLAKSMDNSCPLGPAVVIKEAIPDPHCLYIRSKVNGELKQDDNTGAMIHKVHQIVSYTSRFFTLLPGDVILTGTPSGVGVFQKPPQYLKKGDVVESEIECLGKLKNTIV